MRLRLAHRVRLAGLQAPLAIALLIAQREALRLDAPALWLTSAADSAHSRNSLHYSGAAIDLAIHDAPHLHGQLAALLREALGPDFDVLDEVDHVHVEWQPRAPA